MTLAEKFRAAAKKAGNTNKVGKTSSVTPLQSKTSKKNGASKKAAKKNGNGETRTRATYSDSQVAQALKYIRDHKNDKDILSQRELYFGKHLPIACIREAFRQHHKVDSYRSIGIWSANENDQKKAWKESK